MRSDFGAFILTNRRPTKQITVETLRRGGYSGRLYLIVDDEDPTRAEYEKLYPGQVVVFNKASVVAQTDNADQGRDLRSIIYARNACWDIARSLGLAYFVQLDDDYSAMLYRRHGSKDGELGYYGWTIRSLDATFEALVRFLETTPALTIAMSQGGDHFGNPNGRLGSRLMRKAMNSFVCRTDRPFRFFGRLNEDVNTYTTLGGRGLLFFTYFQLQLNQLQTQSNPGGLTEAYRDAGAYQKPFYTVMHAPSCTRIVTMGRTDRRLHHRINWTCAVPKIIAEKHRKALPRRRSRAS